MVVGASVCALLKFFAKIMLICLINKDFSVYMQIRGGNSLNINKIAAGCAGLDGSVKTIFPAIEIF